MTRKTRSILAVFGALAAALAAGAQGASPPDDVAFERDVVYGKGGGEDLKLDLARPKGGDGPFPCVLVFHGGAWRGGTKTAHDDLTWKFARRGYVSATVGYRFCPKHAFPAQVEDAKCAVRFLRAQAHRWGLDPDRIGAAGFSAGAHLAMMLGVTGREEGLEGDGGWPDASSRVQAVVSFFGPTDFLAKDIPAVTRPLLRDFIGGTPENREEAYRRASPISHVGRGDAPMLLFQGTKDPLVPHTQAYALVEALTAAGVPARVELLVGSGHGWGGDELRRTEESMFAFFDRRLKGARLAASSGPERPPPSAPPPVKESGKAEPKESGAATLRVGIIGTDTSHAVAFTKLLNDAQDPDHVPGARVVAAFKGGSPDVEASATRVDKLAEELRATYGVELADSIDALVAKVDAVLLESVDGRVHLAQARPVFAAKKRLFIEKPLATSLRDGREIVRLARESGVPFFSASALRFCDAVRRTKEDPGLGAVLGCDAYAPATLEPHHPDLFWYGVHGVETLYAVMGPGCESVRRAHTEGADVVVARWKGGRLATLRGTRSSAYGFGARLHGVKATRETPPVEKALYRNLVAEIVRFFQTGVPPVSDDEMLEVVAFMEAAEVSKKEGGREVRLEEVK